MSLMNVNILNKYEVETIHKDTDNGLFIFIKLTSDEFNRLITTINNRRFQIKRDLYFLISKHRPL